MKNRIDLKQLDNKTEIRSVLASILYALVIVTVATSCYYEHEEVEEITQCSDGPVGYQTHIVPVTTGICLQCHNQDDASGGIVLETYEQVKTVAESGQLIGVITHADGYPRMPKDRPKLPECTIQAIKKWVDEGALDN